MNDKPCEFCKRSGCPRAADPVVFAADWEDCLHATAARVDAAERERDEARTDLADVFRWAQSSVPCPPYRERVSGVLDRLDESFALLRRLEATTRAERDEARAKLAAAEGRIEAGLAEFKAGPAEYDRTPHYDVVLIRDGLTGVKP